MKPTKSAIALHSRALETANTHPLWTNQKTLARTLEEMNRTGEIRAHLLPDHLFPNGRIFFEQGGRMLAGDKKCTSCVVVHNNWIVGQKAKKYRFKEHLLWHVDISDYYSSSHRKYVIYNNPTYFGANLTFAKEDAALRSAFAIAHILDRILILPRFHCQGCRICARTGCLDCDKAGAHFDRQTSKPLCYAAVYYSIEKMDHVLPYRESIFLRHKLVPESVKSSVTPVLKIFTGSNKATANQDKINAFTTQGNNGATKKEIVDWFAQYSSVSVLRFHSLYDAFSEFEALADFGQNLKNGLVFSDYRQYNTL